MVQRGTLDSQPLLYGISLGLLLSAIFYLNDIRDRESDAQARKYTLATLLGIQANRFVCTLLLLGAYVPIVWLGLPSHGPHLILITFWTLPGLSAILIGLWRTSTPASLHITMRKAIVLAVLFIALLLIALIITTYWHWLGSFSLPGIPTIF
jgi:1,4-dihydroxy-2-naphthoate octaprenyltransferase